MLRAIVVVLLSLLMGWVFSAEARVSHVSINKSQFTLGEYPRLQMNVVSNRDDFSRLSFYIRQGKSEEKLMVEPVNNFLVLLTGVEDVTDESAELIVREYVINEWQDYKVIPLFGGAERLVARRSPAKEQGAKELESTSKPMKDAAVKSATKAELAKAELAKAELAKAESAKTELPVAKTELPVAETAKTAASNLPSSTTVAMLAAANSAAANAAVGTEVKAEVKVEEKVSLAEPERASAVASVPVSTAASKAASTEAFASISASATDAAPNAASSESLTLASVPGDGGCKVKYEQGQTLWRIASNYGPEWNTNVYGTMLALHDTNPDAFIAGKISGMKQGATFDCPSPAVLSRYPDTREARKQFEARQAL